MQKFLEPSPSEIVRLAGQALGYVGTQLGQDPSIVIRKPDGGLRFWNPIKSNDDAVELMGGLSIVVAWFQGVVQTSVRSHKRMCTYSVEFDNTLKGAEYSKAACEAGRLAITHVASMWWLDTSTL